MSRSNGSREAVQLYNTILDITTNPQHSKWIAPALLLIDAVLCALIIRTVDYTEIDWRAYMQQVEQYMDGERDYVKIYGDTGPLVYPAMHVYIYRALHALTQEGTNIVLAQICFAFLYVFNLGMVMLSYYLAEVPPYVYPMLVLSKRLHSIYVLRCFNDCFAMGLLYIAIYFYQNKKWTEGSLAFSLGLGVKMNLLLVFPAMAVIVYQAASPTQAWRQTLIITQIQVFLGMPFLKQKAMSYLTRAFDLSRQFKYEWTVNWRFIPEEMFLSKGFSIGLLSAHALLLLAFITTRWLTPLNRSPKEFVLKFFKDPSLAEKKRIDDRVDPKFILTTILTANAIGMLCARSLHYQFFSWIAWATPFLLWRSGLHPVIQVFLWSGQELAWNQYPANELSSRIVVGVLAITVFYVWLGTDDEPAKPLARPEQLPKRQKIKAGPKNE